MECPSLKRHQKGAETLEFQKYLVIYSVRSGPGAARTILISHIISASPSKQPLMVGSTLGVYSGGLIAFLQEPKKDYHHRYMMFVRELMYKLTLIHIFQMAAGPEEPVIVIAQPVVELWEDQAPEAAAAGRVGAYQTTTELPPKLCAETEWSQGTRSATTATTGPMTAAAAFVLWSAGTPALASTHQSVRQCAATG